MSDKTTQVVVISCYSYLRDYEICHNKYKRQSTKEKKEQGEFGGSDVIVQYKK